MNYLSLFSGIGGFDLGFDGAGMNCIGQCERDEHAQNVLRHHWPNVKRSDDVKAINRSTFDIRPDLICGGFPCQDLSVAGKRAGLAGGRSGLWFEYHRIISEIKPKWVVVENVPGLLSSQQGRDFAVLIRGLDELGYMGLWKTFDSQYFGVAQRRRRVFIIGYLGKECRSEILFESESLQGNPAEGRKEGEGITGTIKACAKSGGWSNSADHAADGMMVTHSLSAEGCDASEDGTGRGTPLVAAFRESGQGYWMEGTGPLRAEGENRPSRPSNIVAFPQNMSGTQCASSEDLAANLQAKNPTAIAFNLRGREGGAMPELTDKASVRSSCGGSSKTYIALFGVRRLTPRECERLQGFPDDWTRYATKRDGTVYEQSDTQRYRQLGNAVTGSVALALGKMILGR